MGLDTSHNCWHAPYSSFMKWRCNLHQAITGEPATRTCLQAAWEKGVYADQSVPINVLMNHSDCEGDIPAEMCGPLADALKALLAKLPPDAHPWDNRSLTERFIKGLREAASLKQPVEFH